jgi:hypothetical protein
MRKHILITLAIILSACNSSDDTGGPNNNSNLSLTVTASTSSAIIDEMIMVSVSADEAISSIEVSTDNFVTNYNQQSNFGTNTLLYLSFDTLGNKTISVRAKNTNGDEATKTLNVNISRGNAIKIEQLQVVSFYDINNTWDPEFGDTDTNRLADVKFALLKPKVNVFNNSVNISNWYESSIKQNQGDLTWDLSSANLYLNPNLSLRLGLGDDDGNGVGQDLLLGPPFDREITFEEYIATKPNTITLSDPSINLEIELTLNWPQ